VVTYLPQSHIQVCHIIGATASKIEEAKLADPGLEFYGKFILEGTKETFEKMSLIPGITLEIL